MLTYCLEYSETLFDYLVLVHDWVTGLKYIDRNSLYDNRLYCVGQ